MSTSQYEMSSMLEYERKEGGEKTSSQKSQKSLLTKVLKEFNNSPLLPILGTFAVGFTLGFLSYRSLHKSSENTAYHEGLREGLNFGQKSHRDYRDVHSYPGEKSAIVLKGF